MDGYTLSDLREYLQAVRGETRVKDKEEPIRNKFLQAACEEVFQDHDWTFNERNEVITSDSDGLYDVPKTFSVINDYWANGANGRVYKKEAFKVVTDKGKFQLKLADGSTEDIDLHWYIRAPKLDEANAVRIYFTSPMLIAERAYVRLKTAYFPDETSEKELAASRRALRELFTGNQPHQDFTHPALR